MTNREKFKEVFGFDLNTDHMNCIAEGCCEDCPAYRRKYDNCPEFWDDEYEEQEHDCHKYDEDDVKNITEILKHYHALKNDKFNVDVPASIVEHDIRIRSLEKQVEYLTRCVDNCDKLFQLHNQKMDIAFNSIKCLLAESEDKENGNK